MKKLMITALFISMVSFVFANGIKKQTIETKDTQKIEVVKQDVANNLQKNKVDNKSAKPDAVFTCAKEVVVNGETILIVTSAWGINGPRAMKNCNEKLASILVY